MTWQGLLHHRPRRGTDAPRLTTRQDLDADRRPASIAIERELLSVRIGSDVAMDPGFVSQLNGTCSSDPNAFAFLDPSPVDFDNAFYRNLQVGKGLLGSDQVLYSDMRLRSTVNYYASNQDAIFGDFVATMTKLRRIGVKTSATGGEIRRDCRFPN
ncbi:peroxidase 45-like [Miscanthus floridulus]|uniref:peroxidase 45-like n=1 Tax=Miscanthus floridulus TaxID=154761 RepID=UPI0034582A9D